MATPATTVEELERQVLDAATQVYEDLFGAPLPPEWGRTWREYFDGECASEREARELLKGFSKNGQAIPAQWRRVRDYLRKHGVDPEDYDFKRDFGLQMALTLTGEWLLKNYRTDRILTVRDVKSQVARWWSEPSPVWSGMMLTYFDSVPAEPPPPPPIVWNAWPPRIEQVYLTDLEIAALGVIIYGAGTLDNGHVVVRTTDVRDKVTAREILVRQRRCIARARRDLEQRLPDDYEGPRRPSSLARVLRPAVHWPRRWKEGTLAECVQRNQGLSGPDGHQ